MTDDELAAIEKQAERVGTWPDEPRLPARDNALRYAHLETLALDNVPALIAEVRRLRTVLERIIVTPYTMAGDSDTILDACLEIAQRELNGVSAPGDVS